MVLKIVLKVDIHTEKCKVRILQAVTSVEGVDKVEVDGAKGTLTVIGEADPYEIITITRKKAGKFAQFVTVGPPPKPDEKKPDEKKPDEKKPECVWACPCPGVMCRGCGVCKPVAYMTMDYQDPAPTCSIM